MTFLHFALFAIAWACIGTGVLQIGMAHIRQHAGHDNDFLRMTLEDARRSLLMRLPQLAIIVGWPIAVALAIVMNVRAQQRAAYYSLT